MENTASGAFCDAISPLFPLIGIFNYTNPVEDSNSFSPGIRQRKVSHLKNCFSLFPPNSVHPSRSDPQILRLHQVRPLRHRLPREGLPSHRQRRQQRAQLPRQAAQRADEGGELQGHAHEVLASHVFCKCATERG